MSTWYYAKNGQQLGPVTADDLRNKVASGEIALSDLIWREGMASWEPASGVQELGLAYGVSPQPPAGFGIQQPPVGHPGAAPVGYPPAGAGYLPPGAAYAPPGAPQQLGYGGYYGPAASPLGKYNGLAIAAFCVSLGGILCAGYLTELVALVLGIVALVKMKKTGDTKGRGFAVAGVIIASVVWLAYIAIYAYIFTHLDEFK